MPFMTTRCLLILVLVGFSRITFAHDLWFELSSYDPEPSQKVRVDLKSGHAFHGESIHRLSTHLPDFVICDTDGVRQVPGLSGQRPAGIYAAPEGPHVLGYISQPRKTTLPPDKFARHLQEVGITLKEDPSVSVEESYTKCIKALVGGSGAEKLAPLGHPLEFVELSNPFSGDKPKELRGQLREHKKPASNVLIRAFSDNGTTAETRTDSEGQFTLPLSESGRWIIVAVTVQQTAQPSRYDSLWASLTFLLPSSDQTSTKQ